MNIIESESKSEAILENSSFRDPGAIVYRLNNEIYRQINQANYDDYQLLMTSGLYNKLTSLGYLIPHIEVSHDLALSDKARKIIKPLNIDFISYPYEWCFSQLKDAALLTLNIMLCALDYNLILKDASAYNIQFYQGKPILIDTCSFTKYQEGEPWVAYNQFCKHFLAPLALMAKKDIRLAILMQQYIDGIPLDLTSKLLPLNTWFSFGLFAHIHAHAKSQIKYNAINNNHPNKRINKKISKFQLIAMLDNIKSTINKLNWKLIKTQWGNYYDNTNYSDIATQHKINILQNLVSKVAPISIWDMGGNNGYYSRAIVKHCNNIVCFDIDPVAVESNYKKTKTDKTNAILPLIQDLTNPSAAIGWRHQERYSLQKRGLLNNNAKSNRMIMSLALIHHLAIANNIPLQQIAEYFVNLGDYLIVEFIPKEDSKVQYLLSTREDIFTEYDLTNFKLAFSLYYNILDEATVNNSLRSIYLMKSKI